MKIAMRRRLAVAAVLSMTATVAALALTATESAATVSSVSPAAAGNFAPQPTTVNFTLSGSPVGTSNKAPIGSDVVWTRVGTTDDQFVSSVEDNLSPTQQAPSTSVDFSAVTDWNGNDKYSDAPANPGTYMVTFQDPVTGTPLDSCPSCFSVVAGGFPSVTSASPNKVAANTSSAVTFTGNNFARGTTFSILPVSGSAATDVKIEQAKDTSGNLIAPSADGRSYFAQVTIPAGAALGVRDIQATNTNGDTLICSGCFTVLGANLTFVSPSGLTNNDTDNARSITFFGPAGSMASDGVPSLDYVGTPGGSTREALRLVGAVTNRAGDGSSITATYNLAAAAPGSSAYQPTVTSASGSTINVCGCRFSVVQPVTPTLTGLSPSNQNRGSTQQVTVSGTNFSKGAKVNILGGGVTTTVVEYVSRTQLKATFQVDGATGAGVRDAEVVLTDAKKATKTGAYTINGNSPGPSTSSSPSASPTGSPCPSASSSPSASPSATATATTSPSASPSSSASASPSASSGTTSCLTLTLTVSPAHIVPTQGSVVRVHGSPNQAVQVYAYSRPNTTYSVVRSGTTNSTGDIAWTVTPGGNTRLYAHYTSGTTVTAVNDSPSTVITVHTSLSLSAYRDGVRRYHFQGTNLPRRAGQLITLYRYATGPNLDRYCVPTAESDTFNKDDAGCRAIITSQAKTGPNNTWRIDRTFTGSGQFYFVVRTSENINNGRGHSNQRLTIIH
ncbi:MAG: hypothetical protein JJD92_12805 [Frankiaceae bacterium]|nr:hypothetical protein [Frankiaceae bacterium]